jgi:small subunit ribosomal protein S20
MPNIKSAIKRVKVNQKKNLRNRMVKSAMKTQLKKFEGALLKDIPQAQTLLASSQGAVDRAASKGVIHKNAANRRKARMAISLNKALAAKA